MNSCLGQKELKTVKDLKYDMNQIPIFKNWLKLINKHFDLIKMVTMCGFQALLTDYLMARGSLELY